MTYAAPSKADFLARFPTFAAVTDDTYALWAADAAVITGAQETCLGDRIDVATMYLTASYLTDAGIGTGAESEMAAQGASGFTRIKSGGLELEKAKDSSGSSSSPFGSNSYGQRFWAMFKPCVAGPRVSATGTLPCGAVPPWGW